MLDLWSYLQTEVYEGAALFLFSFSNLQTIGKLRGFKFSAVFMYFPNGKHCNKCKSDIDGPGGGRSTLTWSYCSYFLLCGMQRFLDNLLSLVSLAAVSGVSAFLLARFQFH